MGRKKKHNKKHEPVILKGFIANKKVNKTFEIEGFTLLTNNRGGLIDMKPRIDDLYYQFYGRPIELVIEEFPTALWEWNVENNK